MPTRTRTLAAAAIVATIASMAPAAGAEPEDLARPAVLAQRGDYAEAERALDELGAAGKRGGALLLRARIELDTGRYGKAAETARAASAQGREARVAAAPLRAEALRRLGKLDEAIRAAEDVAREPEARRARLQLGELLIEAGRRGEARAPLMTLVDDYNSDAIAETDAEGLTMVGRAAHLLRSPRDANDAYNAAEKAGGEERVETLLWRAELFLDKYDPGHAGEVVKEALRLAPKSPEAHVLMARVRLESTMDFDAAEREIRAALEVNPNLAPAYAVRAGLALRDMDIEAADAALDRGLQIDPRDLELLSLKAAARFLADDLAGYEALRRRVFGYNALFSTFYGIVSEYAEWEHRYDDIVRMMREAITVDPGDAKAHAALGLNLLRAGDDDAGLAALRKAWEKDRFNVRVYNTLNLYEKTIAREYVTVDGQRFRIRYLKDEKPVLERYVPRLLDEAWASMVKRYGFTPRTPVSIELYADPQHFSVRTSGLPNVGIQGVCFGQSLAAMSPAAGEINWGNVLWHEVGHVFAIQLSKSHVPRWFTEGLSEYETLVQRPEWQREEDPALYAALRAGRVPEVASFNRAFTHVDDVSDVTMAYYAASQIVVYLAKEHGFDRVVAMLPRWASGARTPEVVKESLGIDASELDRRYRAWLKTTLARYDGQYLPDLDPPALDEAQRAVQASPRDARKLVELALAMLGEGKEAEAQATLAEALRVDPKQPDAVYVKLRIAAKKKQWDAALALADQLVAGGHDGYVVRMKAADAAEGLGDTEKQRAHLEAAARLDPSMVEPLEGLFDLAHDRKDAAGELDALRKLARLDQNSRKVYRALLERLVKRGEWEEARKVGEAAMYVDVTSARTHFLYARALARTGRHVSAVFELNSALACKPPPDAQAEIYGELAAAYDKMGEKEYTEKARSYQRDAAARGGGPEGESEG
jgi:tetratricopeptide (TPR) repeat protein